jgi:hypothetical protein
MSSAGAGAVVSGSGAIYELRWRFERFHSGGGIHLDHRAQCLRGCTAHWDAVTNTNSDRRPIENPEANTDAEADSDANVHSGNERGSWNDGAG